MFASLVFYLCKREQYTEYMVANVLIMPLTLLRCNNNLLTRVSIVKPVHIFSPHILNNSQDIKEGKKQQHGNISECKEVLTLVCVQTDATTPNIVVSTMLGVVACMLAMVCKWMQQLPTMLGPAVHRGKDITYKSL